MKRHHIQRHYNFNKSVAIHVDLVYLVNQIIHSYVFEFVFSGDNRLNEIAFASDKDSSKFCNVLELSKIASIFELVGKDYPSTMKMKRAPDGDWMVDEIFSDLDPLIPS